MAKNKKLKSHEQLVKEYHPNAICVDREFGKSYKLIKDGNSILSEGKTSSNAWLDDFEDCRNEIAMADAFSFRMNGIKQLIQHATTI